MTSRRRVRLIGGIVDCPQLGQMSVLRCYCTMLTGRRSCETCDVFVEPTIVSDGDGVVRRPEDGVAGRTHDRYLTSVRAAGKRCIECGSPITPRAVRCCTCSARRIVEDRRKFDRRKRKG